MTKNSPDRNFADYLSVGEAAEFLGVSPWTLRNWDNLGKLPSDRHPVSGYRMYSRESLESLLRNGKVLGRRSSLLTPKFTWSEIDETEHLVQFYENDKFLIESACGFVLPSLLAGEGVLIIARSSYRNRIHKKLERRGVDVAAAQQRGQYVALDAAKTLSKFMVDDRPDAARFESSVGTVVQQLKRRGPRLRAFGEMVSLLWSAGNGKAACQLERLWCAFAARHRCALLCAYPIDEFRETADDAFFEVCDYHSRVIPTESYFSLSKSSEQLRAIAALQQKAKQLEAEIARRRDVERELSDFVENALEGLNKVGSDGTILWANRAELELLGYEPDEYIGHHVSEFHTDTEAADEILDRLQRGEDLYNWLARLRHKDGSIRHVLIHSNGCFEGGQFVYSRCYTRDVTEVQAANRDRAMLAAIIESSQDAIVSKTFDGIIRSWNVGAERLFGYTEAEAVGQPITIIIPPDRLQEEHDILSRLRRGERIEHYETVRIRKDGQPLDISLTISPLCDANGTFIGASKIARDITARKRTEEMLREAHRRKDQFLATLAHELRNPLAPIRNGLHLLRSMAPCGPETRNVLDMMERQVAHLVRLIDDLLEISRINRGTIELKTERLDLATIINHAVETSKPLIEAGNHALEICLPESPIIIEGDLIRLSQAFSNLLINAARYTKTGGRITVAGACEGREVVVAVKDTGVGIPKHMLTQIFEIFTQVDNSLRQPHNGLGIGLSIARTLVEMHGGSIEARSEGLDHGSQFIVRLPAAELEMTGSEDLNCRGETPENIQPGRRILVVDDNRDSVDTLGRLLKLQGEDVRVAYDGQSAIDVVNTFRPAIVLMDLGMPDMDGCAVARLIRQDPANQDVLLIAMTGWGQEEDRKRSRDAGFDHHLVKPVDIDLLKKLLASGPSNPEYI